MDKEIFKAEFCSLYWNERLQYVREEWRVVNCAFEEFKSMNFFLQEFCIKKEIKSLIIDTFDAISLLPDKHHEWLENEFNETFMERTRIENVITILPESLVTSISVNKFYDNLKMTSQSTKILKMKSIDEVLRFLESQYPRNQ
jgi:pectate lyase